VDTKKERGFVAVRTKASLPPETRRGQGEGLDDIDVSELPPPFFANATDVALAFRYFTPPWSLGLAVSGSSRA